MSNIDLVRAITEADLPLETVDQAVLAQLKALEHTYVSARQLRSAKNILISEGFARCQGVVFLDDKKEIGALAHNYSQHDPYHTLTGEWTGGEFHLENPRHIFTDMGKVLAVHVFHIHNYEWPERWVEGALRKVGIEKVVHIPIKPKEDGKYWRHVAVDVKDGSVYVFPTDFDFGIKYHPNGSL